MPEGLSQSEVTPGSPSGEGRGKTSPRSANALPSSSKTISLVSKQKWELAQASQTLNPNEQQKCPYLILGKTELPGGAGSQRGEAKSHFVSKSDAERGPPHT